LQRMHLDPLHDSADPVGMATLKQKIEAETKVRELLETEGLPEPDEVEYDSTCIRLLWHRSKLALVVDIDPLPEGVDWPERAAAERDGFYVYPDLDDDDDDDGEDED
jgi:hypothetical protein